MNKSQETKLDFSLGDKKFDCVQFKRKLQENAWKNSGAKTIEEYCEFVRISVRDSEFVKRASNYKPFSVEKK